MALSRLEYLSYGDEMMGGESSNETLGPFDAMPKGPVVFVSDFVHMAVDESWLVSRLSGQVGEWLAPIAIEAASQDGGPKVRVGAGAMLSKVVRVEFGEPRTHDSTVVVPMFWEATGPTRLFPHLDADLELSSLGPGESRLGLSGRYRIPLGVVGSAVNKALLHRVAEATMRRFLVQLAAALEAGRPQ